MTPNTTYYPAHIDLPEELVQIKATLKATDQQVRLQYIRRGKSTSGLEKSRITLTPIPLEDYLIK